MSFSDPIDGTNAGGSGGSAGSTGGSTGSTGGPGGGTPGGTGGLGGGTTGGLGGSAGGSDAGGYGGSTGGSTGGLGGSTGGLGGSAGGKTGGLGGSTDAGTSGTGGSDAGGYGGSTGGSTGGLGGSTGGLGGSAGGTTGGAAGGLGGSTGGLGDGSPGLGGSTGGTGETGGAGDDFDLHEPTYRRHYTTVGTETAGGTTGTYDEARTGYAAGHAAASNPAYADRPYEDVEVDIERNVGTERFGRVREFARHAFEWKRVLAGVAVVAGGYWASKKLFAAASELSEHDEQDCRTFYDTHPMRSAGVPYSQARTVYVLGYVAGRNPDYSGRGYDEVEPHLRSGYTGRGTGSYDALRDFGRRGYERSSTRTS
jgi:hypothetical protein